MSSQATELARVKAAVKAWEKAFRAAHGRAPTKDDIRADTGDIEQQYAEYRRLVKAGAAPSASQSSARASMAEPATPTRAKSRSKPAPTAEGNAAAGPSRGKRPVDALTSTPSRHASTPKRARPDPSPFTPGGAGTPKRAGYSVIDPNPFSVSPKRPNGLFPSLSAKGKRPSAEAGSPFIEHDSPFIHANSPRKLREVLEANSLRKSRERAEITPRTKARKRLAGEHVDDTPFKVRKRRGERAVGGERGPAPESSSSVHASDPVSEDIDDDDEGLGETPVAPGAAAFSLLSAGRNGTSREPVEQPSRTNLYALFQKARRDEPAPAESKQTGRAAKGKAANGAKSTATGKTNGAAGRAARAAAILAAADDDMDAEASTAQPSTPPALPAKSPARTPRRAHVVTLSDDEVDEWDPEGETRKLAVRVTGTRRRAVRVAPRAGIASDDEGEGEGAEGEQEGEAEVVHEEEADDAANADDDADAAEAPHMLSLLSLRSPAGRKGERLADLRVRALLDPTSAAAVLLRAQRRGQDVFGAGEDVGIGGGWRGEESDVEVVDEAEGDDDWESDPEGWKAETVEEEW
ncbi:hypothetical protein Q8F55_004353 [Vanrija albida]|uniref:DNA replication regulator SLD2 n=1 Tax=Vanrija albida TaxID=181172 RepID=A0ABR3Q6S6_9TREE